MRGRGFGQFPRVLPTRLPHPVAPGGGSHELEAAGDEMEWGGRKESQGHGRRLQTQGRPPSEPRIQLGLWKEDSPSVAKGMTRSMLGGRGGEAGPQNVGTTRAHLQGRQGARLPQGPRDGHTVGNGHGGPQGTTARRQARHTGPTSESARGLGLPTQGPPAGGAGRAQTRCRSPVEADPSDCALAVCHCGRKLHFSNTSSKKTVPLPQ